MVNELVFVLVGDEMHNRLGTARHILGTETF